MINIMTGLTDMTNQKTTEMTTFLNNALAGSTFSIEEIAKRMGLPNPDIIRMFAAGEAKVPLEKVRSLAEALGCPVEPMMIAALRSVLPEHVMADIELAVLSEAHGSIAAEYIRAVKSVTGGTLPPITPNIRRRLWIALGRLD